MDMTIANPTRRAEHQGFESPHGLRLLDRHEAFADALGRATRSLGARAETPESMARRGAEQLVATAFIQPLLKQVREGSMSAPPFAPTQGEKQFGAFVDSKLAHDVVRAARLPIVDRIAADLLQRTRGAVGAPVVATNPATEANT